MNKTMSPFHFTTTLKTKMCVTLISCFVLPTFLFASELPAPQQTVSLQQVLENITQTDPSILEAMKQYQSVLAERGIAESEYYPIVGTEISAGPERTDGVDTNDVEENLIATDASLFARQNLYNGGKTTAFVKETDARIQAAAYEVLNVANDVYLDTAEAYINVVKGRVFLAIAEENALTQEKIMRQVREKTEAGFSRVSDLYNSESRLALAKGSYISRQQDLNQALVVFHRQFGRFLDVDQFVKPEPTYQIPATLPDTVEIAFRNHPALKVRKEYQRSYIERRNVNETVRLAWNIKEAEDYKTQYLSEHVELSEKTLDAFKEEYYVGRRSLLDLLNSENEFTDAKLSLSESQFSHLIAIYRLMQATGVLLNEHDTGLIGKLEISPDEKDDIFDEENPKEVAAYENINANRDADQIADIKDQCDNSASGSSPQPYGCDDNDVNTTGYPHTDDSTLSPYIVPQSFDTSAEEQPDSVDQN